MNQLAPAPSPFIEGTNIQFAWDSTSLGLLKECPRKYYYTMIEGWRPRGDSVHLRFGLLFHAALELYDNLRIAHGFSHEDAMDSVVDEVLNKTWDGREIVPHFDDLGVPVVVLDTGAPWDSQHDKKNRWTLLRTVVWYLDAHKDDPAKTLILPNGKPAVELSFRFEIDHLAPNGQPYLLSGHMDRVVDFLGSRYVMDRKTSGSALSAYFFNQFDPDNQMSLYTFASRVVYNEPVAGVIIDGAQVAVGFSTFARGITLRSQGQIDEWLEDTKHWLDLGANFAQRGFWPMNDKSCHKYDGCPFRQVCNKDPVVRRNYLETNFEIRHWNPLETR